MMEKFYNSRLKFLPLTILIIAIVAVSFNNFFPIGKDYLGSEIQNSDVFDRVFEEENYEMKSFWFSQSADGRFMSIMGRAINLDTEEEKSYIGIFKKASSIQSYYLKLSTFYDEEVNYISSEKIMHIGSEIDLLDGIFQEYDLDIYIDKIDVVTSFNTHYLTIIGIIGAVLVLGIYANKKKDN